MNCKGRAGEDCSVLAWAQREGWSGFRPPGVSSADRRRTPRLARDAEGRLRLRPQLGLVAELLRGLGLARDAAEPGRARPPHHVTALELRRPAEGSAVAAVGGRWGRDARPARLHRVGTRGGGGLAGLRGRRGPLCHTCARSTGAGSPLSCSKGVLLNTVGPRTAPDRACARAGRPRKAEGDGLRAGGHGPQARESSFARRAPGGRREAFERRRRQAHGRARVCDAIYTRCSSINCSTSHSHE